eukprot:1060942-Rhodomonas_salina.2
MSCYGLIFTLTQPLPRLELPHAYHSASALSNVWAIMRSATTQPQSESGFISRALEMNRSPSPAAQATRATRVTIRYRLGVTPKPPSLA